VPGERGLQGPSIPVGTPGRTLLRMPPGPAAPAAAACCVAKSPRKSRAVGCVQHA